MTSPPPLDEQLVLELERRIAIREALKIFPCGRRGRFSYPPEENLANPPGKTRAHGAFRLQHGGTVMHRRQRWRSSWRNAHELLQEADMEDVVKSCTWRQLDPVHDVVDDGRDTVRSVEPRAKLPFGGHLQRCRRTMSEA